MDPINLLFGFKGRIGRANYWLAVLIWFIVWSVAAALMIISGLSMIAVVIAAIIMLPTVASLLAAGLKRVHDRKRSGSWLVMFYVVPLVGFTTANLIEARILQSVLSLVGFLFTIWAFVELGCLRGSIGVNQYGPDPVAPRPAKH